LERTNPTLSASFGEVVELGLLGPSADEAEANMYYIYVLQSKRNNKLYVGLTNNIKRRFLEHNFSKRQRNGLKEIDHLS